jgi:hypothetical protein
VNTALRERGGATKPGSVSAGVPRDEVVGWFVVLAVLLDELHAAHIVTSAATSAATAAA